jgi:hypothetical protein
MAVYTVSISLDNPNPLLAKLQPNLFMPIYDSTTTAVTIWSSVMV